jgi:hypothetical protein
VTITEVWVVGHTAGEPKTDPVDISGLAVGDTMAIAYGISVTRNSDGSVTFSGVEQNDSYGIGTGSNTFNAVDVQDVTGKFDLGIFALTTTNQGHNIDMNFGVTATDADGDPSTGTIDVTLVPSGSSSLSTLSVQSNQLLSQEPLNTSSLFSSTDSESQKTTTNSNNVLMGAFAAAGLAASDPLAAEGNHTSLDSQLGSNGGEVHLASLAPVAVDSVNDPSSSELLGQGGGAGSAKSESSHANGHSTDAATHDTAAGHSTDVQAPASLPQGTDAPANDAGGAPAALTAMGVNMPSAEQLAAAGLSGKAPSV